MTKYIPNNITSGFALLDVKSGRKGLSNHFCGKSYSDAKKIPVTIKGFIAGQWGDDDGTSIEFHVEVDSVKLGAVK